MNAEALKQDYLAVVRDFCAWAEAPEPASNSEIMAVREMLLKLLLLTPKLEKINGDVDFTNYDAYRSETRKLTVRVENFPTQRYSMVFDPFDEADQKSIYGVFWDDLEDIYRDLKTGLNAYEAGEREAAFSYWVSFYFFHWGRHANMAAMALGALHIDKRLE